MPFKSQRQRRLCWRQWRKKLKQGQRPTWNCPEWERATAKLQKRLFK